MYRGVSIIKTLIIGVYNIICVLFKILVCIVYVFTVALYYASKGV